MVVSVVICSSKNEILLSRQFIEISLNKIKGYISEFCRIIQINKNANFFEHNELYYYYVPIDNELYVVMICLNTSNVIENQKIINSIYTLISKVLENKGLTKQNIKDNSLSIIEALDEMISVYGYIQEEDIQRILLNLKMDSSYEKKYLKEKIKKDMEIKEKFDEKMLLYEKSKNTNENLNSYSSIQHQEKLKEEETINNIMRLIKEQSNTQIIESLLRREETIEEFVLSCHTLMSNIMERELQSQTIIRLRIEDGSEINDSLKFLPANISLLFKRINETEYSDENENIWFD